MTTTDQTAIEFYQENLAYVTGFGLSNLEREDRRLYNKGKKLIEEALNAKSKGPRVPFTLDEILPVWDEYLKSYLPSGQNKVFDRHVALEGMTNRDNPVASAMGLHGQITFYDNNNKTISKNFDRAGKTLKGLMEEYNKAHNVNRFNVQPQEED
jgi:hypothetical protein